MNKPTFADVMTLDEIGENDVEMVKDAIKNAKKYRFGTDKMKAIRFVHTCLDNTLRFLGVVVSVPNSHEARERYAAKLDRIMEEKQIRIENRPYYRGADQWRCGIYIYQRDELVAFISDVFTERRTEADPVSMKITKEDVGFMVITNARQDDTQRIWTPGIVKGGRA